MEVAPAAVESFARDGAVLLPGLLDREWLTLLEAGVERNLAEPSEWAQQYTPEGEPGQFFGDYCSWDRIPEFRTVALESGLADVARRLMGSTTARFFHEHVLVKEPGTREITPWHHDQPYYCVDGDQQRRTYDVDGAVRAGGRGAVGRSATTTPSRDYDQLLKEFPRHALHQGRALQRGPRLPGQARTGRPPSPASSKLATEHADTLGRQGRAVPDRRLLRRDGELADLGDDLRRRSSSART